MARTAAVFFDVDFTLIHPGPKFQGSGYGESCARHGVTVDASRFDAAVAGAATVLESADAMYDPELYLEYTRRIIELMGGTEAGVDIVAREIYDEWAKHHHFTLYDDVMETLTVLRDRGVGLGIISNSHRCLTSFSAHFDLDAFISVAISSPVHGYLKPHPNIFHAALMAMDVPAESAAMVGDSLSHDVLGARGVGMQGILLARGARGAGPVDAGITVIGSLRELSSVLFEE